MNRREISLFPIFFILPIFYLCGTLTSSQTFFMRDLTYLFHPWRSLASQMIQAGEMPLWNSYAMGGMPFLANCQSAILYPFTILFNFLAFPYALKIFHLFHYALAGIGTYLLARKLGWNCYAGWAGAILFSFNGYLLTRLEFLSLLGSAIWLPWILLFSIHRTSMPFRIPEVCLALLLSFSLFAGFPQILLLQMGAVFLFYVIHGDIISQSKAIGVTLLLFLLISSVQWIPTLELMLQSGRGGNGVSFEEAVTYSLPIDSLLGLIYPFRILHHPDRFTGEKFFWIWSAWWGIAASLILPFSFKTKNKKIFWFALILTLAGIFWAMGNQWETFKKIYQLIPMVRLFRYPPVTLYWTVLGVALLFMCAFGTIQKLRWGKLLSIVLLTLVALELYHYSRNLFPTVIPDYYHATFPGIKSIIQDHPGTIMISNRLNSQRRLAGMTDLEARMRFRSSFFDLTNLPYQTKSIVFSGEPLALKSYGNLYNRLVTSPNLNEARILLNLWNVTHFLTYDTLDKSWELLSSDSDLKVYRNPTALGISFAIPTLSPFYLKKMNDKIIAHYESDKDLKIFFNSPYYPGWKIVCSHCEVHNHTELTSSIVEGYFIGTQVKSGTHSLYLFYDSILWRVGLLISLVSLLVLIGMGLKQCRLIYQ